MLGFLIGRYTGRRAERRRIIRAVRAAEAERIARLNTRPHSTAAHHQRKDSP